MKIGSIYTIAGTGEAGFGGEGGDARSAMLNEPKGVAVDRKGNIYIADTENCLIMRVDTNGYISAIAGHFLPHSESGSDVEEMMYQRQLGKLPRKEGLPSDSIGDNGPAILSSLRFPSAIAVDKKGNIYISDTLNNRVRKVDVTSGIITTIAGNGQDGSGGDEGQATEANLSEPSSIAIDRNENIFIADLMNHKIRKVDAATGVITTVAGSGGNASFSGDDGPAIDAGLAAPSGVAVDNEGNIFIADSFNNRIRMVDKDTGFISTIAGDDTSFSVRDKKSSKNSLSQPYSIAIDSKGDIYTTDSDNHMVRKIYRKTGEIVTVAGNGKAGFSPDETPANEASLNYPFGITIGQNGNIYIADTFNHMIRKILIKEI
ncbi:MAG: hypothetical protein AAB313_02760 [Deltaproteobacteria bacterium]